jgi:hypothetical protein
MWDVFLYLICKWNALDVNNDNEVSFNNIQTLHHIHKVSTYIAQINM